jgi:hypothetical protein
MNQKSMQQVLSSRHQVFVGALLCVAVVLPRGTHLLPPPSFIHSTYLSTMTSSLRRTDILALSNLRNDGRKAEEIRRMRIQIGTSSEKVGGSALVEMGLTVALATVSGPMECTRRSEELPDRYV